MPIIGPFPANIAAGQDVAAAPVMADLNWIRSEVNANAQPIVAANLSRVMVKCITGGNFGNGIPRVVGKADTGPTVTIDALGEFSTLNGLFTAQFGGYYQINAQVTVVRAGATLSAPAADLSLFQNAVLINQSVIFATLDSAVTQFTSWASAVAFLSAGDTLSASAKVAFSAGGPPQFATANLSIIAL